MIPATTGPTPGADCRIPAGSRSATSYPDPEQLLRLGRARLETFLRRWSRGHWGRAKAEQLRSAARESIALWDGGMDFAALAEDIRAEAVQHQFLTGQIDALDARIAEKRVAERSNAPTRLRPSNQEPPPQRLTTLRNLVGGQMRPSEGPVSCSAGADSEL